MAGRFMRSAFRGVLLLASASSTACAWAQTIDPATPRAAIDENGVDLSAGQFIVSGASVSIGGARGLTWSQGRDDIIRSRFYTQTNSQTNVLEYFVSIGDDAVVFLASGAGFVPKERSGASLTLANGTYTYTSHAGDILTFISPSPYIIMGYTGGGYIPLSLKRANGETITFYYDRVTMKAGRTPPTSYQNFYYMRLGGLISNTGYAMRVRHGAESISPDYVLRPPIGWEYSTGVALGTTDCASMYGSCSTQTMAWSQGSNGKWSVTDAAGRTTTATESGIKLPGSSTNDVSVSYTNGRVSSVVAAGVTTAYNISDSGDVRTAVVTRGSLPARITTFRIATRQVLSEQWKTDPSGPTYTRSYSYDPASALLTRITEPEGNYTAFSYDARGNVTETRVVSKTPGTPPDLVTRATYDAACANAVICNQPITTTDVRGGVTNYAYDPVHGGVTSMKAPAPDPNRPNLRPETRYSYSQLGSNGAALLLPPN